MRILPLAIIGMYINILSAFSQNTTDTSLYKGRKLKLDEINFVSAYYHQDGNSSAITGGTGTERLTDVTNTIDLKMIRYDHKHRKNAFQIELGVDHYTSASSDKIDPATISSASMDDTRIYPSISWSRDNDIKGTNFGVTASYSREADYKSYGTGLHLSKVSADKNRGLDINLQVFLDEWKVIYPEELRPPNYGTAAKNDRRQVDQRQRNSYAVSLSFSQVINKKFQLSLLADPTYQEGLLATKYHRVYFSDGSMRSENLPHNKFKLPLGIRSSYFLRDQLIIRSLYRFYIDDWGLKAHTIELEAPLKFSPCVSVSPFYRFHIQNATDHFATHSLHHPDENYYTSDHDLSALNSHFFGIGLRLSPPKGILGAAHWNMLEIRYGHYNRSTGLQSNIISLHSRFR